MATLCVSSPCYIASRVLTPSQEGGNIRGARQGMDDDGDDSGGQEGIGGDSYAVSSSFRYLW